jgi:hypothetical protein
VVESLRIGQPIPLRTLVYSHTPLSRWLRPRRIWVQQEEIERYSRTEVKELESRCSARERPRRFP